MSAAAAAVSSLPMTVLAADEAQRWRELLGEGRQLGSAMREILDGAELLGGRGGHGLRLLAGRLGSAARLPESLGDLCGQLGALASDLRDLFAGVGGLGRGVRDAIEILQPGGGILDDLAQIAANSFDQLRRAIQSAAGVLHRLSDASGLTSARLPQLLLLLSHDRETPALDSGARRFDLGGGGAEIGLIGVE